MPVEQLVITDREAGKGLNPTHPGYQVAACSPGLDERLRETLLRLSTPFGRDVHSQSHAPADAIAREDQWLRTVPSLQAPPPVPVEILNDFPVIWGYADLGQDLFALIRVSYLGWTYDKPTRRLGNFLAHALVFPPDALAPWGYNPMALRRSALFISTDDGQRTSLPTLSDLGGPTGVATDVVDLALSPFREHLAGMTAGLCESRHSGRPMVLCLPDWRGSAPTVEALLNLLPPSARCRCTCCTYASDLPSVRDSRTGPAAKKSETACCGLTVACGDNARSLRLSPGSYGANAEHAIFNFVEGRASETGAPGPYADFVAESVSSGRPARLASHHESVEKLGLASECEAWDALIPAAALDEPNATAEAMGRAVRALKEVAAQPPQAAVVLDMMRPRVKRLASQAGGAAALRAMAADLAALADLASTASGGETARRFIAELRVLASDAFQRGAASVATALLASCGRAREDQLLALLTERVGTAGAANSAPLAPDDRGSMLDLLLDGLRLCDRTPDAAVIEGPMLAATFRAAKDAGKQAEIWRLLGESRVMKFLEGNMDAGKLEVLQTVAQCMPEETCPAAYVRLNLRLLAARPPRTDQLFACLEKVADAAKRCAADAPLAEELRKAVIGLSRDPREQAIALGRMSERCWGAPVGESLFRAYQNALQRRSVEVPDVPRPPAGSPVEVKPAPTGRAPAAPRIPADHDAPGRANDPAAQTPVASADRFAVRGELAKAGVVSLLCHEFLGEMLPWNDASGARLLETWQNQVFGRGPRVRDLLRKHIAERLAQPGPSGASVLPLAEKLIAGPSGGGTGEGLLALYQAVVQTLPLEPLSRERAQLFASPPAGLDRRAAGRLDVLRLMAETSVACWKPEWSLTKFPHDDPKWRAVRNLDAGEKDLAVRWFLGTFADTGVTTPEQARSLWQMLDVIDLKRPDDVAEAAGRLLERADGTYKMRDSVTCLEAAMGFARLALEGSGPAQYWVDVFALLVKKFDGSTRALLESHLEGRFCRAEEPDYVRRMQTLCQAAGLKLPRGMEPAPTRPPEPRAPGRTGPVPSQPQQGGGGLWNSVKSVFKVFGRKPKAPDGGGVRKHPFPAHRPRKRW